MASGAFFNHTVEDGLVAILRGFRYSLEPLVPNIVVGDITGKLTVGGPASFSSGLLSGGADVQGYANFQLGQYQSDYQPCYVIAGPGMTISLILTFSGIYEGLLVGPDSINVEFYGQKLLATGRPVNYEPGFSDPLPVYDRSDYQKQRENDLVSTTSLSKNKATAAFSPIALPIPVPRAQYHAPRPASRPAASARAAPQFQKRNRWR